MQKTGWGPGFKDEANAMDGRWMDGWLDGFVGDKFSESAKNVGRPAVMDR